MLNQPILNVLVPRLTYLRSSNDELAYSDVIMQVTRVLCISVIPLGLTISVNSVAALLAWSGDQALGDYGSIFTWEFYAR